MPRPSVRQGTHHSAALSSVYRWSRWHFQNAIDLDCANDEAAKESAKQFVGEHDVELWQRDRFIERFFKAEEPGFPSKIGLI